MSRVFTPSLQNLDLSLGASLLETIDRTWSLVSGPDRKKFSKGKLKDFADWVSARQRDAKPVQFTLPMLDERHYFVVVRAPLTSSPANCELQPQFNVVADDFTLLWRLEEPAPIGTVKAIAEHLAKPLGGKAVLNEPVPLPGTVMPKEFRPGLVQHFPVHLMVGTRVPAYRVVGTSLRGPAPATAPAVKIDPNALTVSLGEDEAGNPAFYRPRDASNAFFLMVGASGGGKTEAIRKTAAGIIDYGIPVLTFDYHGDVDVPRSETVVLADNPMSTLGINPLELYDPTGTSQGMYDQRAAFGNLIRRACPRLGHLQIKALTTALKAIYANAGIHDHDLATWKRKPPAVSDLLTELDRMAEDKDQAKAVEGIHAFAGELFGHPVFHRKDYVSIEALSTRSFRLDLFGLEDREKFVVTETVLRRVFSALQALGPIPRIPKNDRERYRLFVVIDEVQKLVDGGGAEILDILFREARKFGLGMILGTQSASNLTKDILANAGAWLVLLHLEAIEAGRTAKNIGIASERLLTLNGRGDGYLRVGRAPATRIQVRALSGSRTA